MEPYTTDFREALLSVDRIRAANIAKKYVEENQSLSFVDGMLQPALEEIGLGWEKGVYSLSQVYMSGKICEEIISQISLNLPINTRNSKSIAIVVLEDFHVLGKRILFTTLKACGYQITDLGCLTVKELLEQLNQKRYDILMISVLMLSSALKVSELTKALALQPIKIMVGGAPFRFDPELWKEVGAHASGNSLAEAVKLVNEESGL